MINWFLFSERQKIKNENLSISYKRNNNQNGMSSKNVEHLVITKAESKKEDVNVRHGCVSDECPGISCAGDSYEDPCLGLFLWCRDNFLVMCSPGLCLNMRTNLMTLKGITKDSGMVSQQLHISANNDSMSHSYPVEL